jgi:tetratricopeptide (TPR) repeat protein
VRVLVAALVLFACRGDEPAPRPRASPVESTAGSVVPKLPRSRDGRAEMRELDGAIGRAEQPGELVRLLLSRAAVRGGLEDLVRALALSERWIAEAPNDLGAWQARVTALSRVHRFAAAREALARVKELATDPADWQDLSAVLAEATGEHARAAEYRKDQAERYPNPRTITHHAMSLAMAGRVTDAIALVPKAAAVVRDNPATLVAWLLVQWGKLSLMQGEHAAARRFFEEAHVRLPASVEAAALLGESVRATGGDPSTAMAAALVENPRHPELLALAGKTADARLAWERHVTDLPEAFSDHAARFFLGAGAAPARALALARTNLANRSTAEARVLVVEAALAANEPATACEVAAALAGGTRVEMFLAWRAFAACGRTTEAQGLAARLGI